MTHAPITITGTTMHSAAALAELADSLPEGVVIRFTADAYAPEPDEWLCPLCERDHCASGRVVWVRALIPGAWDLVQCLECKRQFGVEAHLLESVDRCSCGLPATIEAVLPHYLEADDVPPDWMGPTACGQACAIREGEEIAARLRDCWETYETDLSLRVEVLR